VSSATAPTYSNEMLSAQLRHSLLSLALHAVEYGVANHRSAPIKKEDYPQALQQPGASFVTLTIDGQLRGCIGTLEARCSLVEDVADNAYAAAFRDPRFNELTADEFVRLHFHISILTPHEPMQVSSQQDLLQQLRPGIDGLVLSDQGKRATFLPSVWESLPDAKDFVYQLKQKAGFTANYWSDTMKVERYSVEDFADSYAAILQDTSH